MQTRKVRRLEANSQLDEAEVLMGHCTDGRQNLATITLSSESRVNDASDFIYAIVTPGKSD